MNLYKNLNDIPIQFRQYEDKINTSKEDNNNISIEANNTKKDKTNVFEKIPEQSNISNCRIDIKDKLFIFLILAIFFDAL